MDEKSLPVRFEAKVDATNALDKTVENSSKGISRVFHALVGKREADVAAHAQMVAKQAEINKLLMDHGLAKFDFTTGTVSHLLTPEKTAVFLLQLQAARAPQNIAACLQHTARALEEAPPEAQDQRIDLDFLDAWLDAAKRMNSEYLQNIWGRILAENIRQENAISLRTALSLALVGTSEAELFTHILQYRLQNIIVLPSTIPDKGIQGIRYVDILSLTDAGFLITDGDVTLTDTTDEPQTTHTFVGSGAAIKFETTTPCKKFSLPGHPLSTMGMEVARIANPDPVTEDVLKYFYEVNSMQFPKQIKAIYAYKVADSFTDAPASYDEHDLICEYIPPTK